MLEAELEIPGDLKTQKLGSDERAEYRDTVQRDHGNGKDFNHGYIHLDKSIRETQNETERSTERQTGRALGVQDGSVSGAIVRHWESVGHKLSGLRKHARISRGNCGIGGERNGQRKSNANTEAVHRDENTAGPAGVILSLIVGRWSGRTVQWFSGSGSPPPDDSSIGYRERASSRSTSVLTSMQSTAVRSLAAIAAAIPAAWPN